MKNNPYLKRATYLAQSVQADLQRLKDLLKDPNYLKSVAALPPDEAANFYTDYQAFLEDIRKL